VLPISPIMDRPVVPIFSPVIGSLELEYVSEAVRTGWVSSAGPFLAKFEAAFAAKLGIQGAVAVSSGTAALHVALHARGIGPEHEVIVPSQTFVATAAAVRYCGATPVFADIRRDTWTIDVADVVRKLSPRTRAVIPVDLFGLCANVPLLRAELLRAGRKDLFILEDAAEAFGSSLDGAPAGTLGDAAIFSFYGNKTITTGEGGMVTTADGALAERVRFLKDYAMSQTKRYYHPELGFNFRMTNMQAAIGLAQLAAAETLIANKRRIHARYRKALGAEHGIHLQAVPEGHSVAPWLTNVVDDALTGEATRDLLMQKLGERGIDTRPMFYPNHLMPPFCPRPEAVRGTLPVTEDVSLRGIGLPSGAGLRDDEIDRVIETYLRERKFVA
jgi:perosamine synthetase